MAIGSYRKSFWLNVLLEVFCTLGASKASRFQSGVKDIPVIRRTLLDPWTGQLSSIGSPSIALINGALSEAASGDATRAGATVFSFVEQYVANKSSYDPTSTSSTATLSSLLGDATLQMEQIVTLVSHPLSETLPPDVASALAKMQSAHSYLTNTYLQWAQYTSRGGFDLPSDPDLLSLLRQSPAEGLLGEAASSLLASGPQAIPAALLAAGQHLALLQERYFRGERAYRHVVRKYAASYLQDFSPGGAATARLVASLFAKAGQNYPDSTFTLRLPLGGQLAFVSGGGQEGLRVEVPRASFPRLPGAAGEALWALCTEASSNSSCGLVSQAASMARLAFHLALRPAFAEAIDSLDTLRGFGNLDQVSDTCLGCTLSLADALSANLALNAPTSQSSGANSSLAVDGRHLPLSAPPTCTSSNPGGSSDPFWRADLGTTQAVTAVHLFTPPGAQVNGARVYVGEDSTKYNGYNAECTFAARPFWALDSREGGTYSVLCEGRAGRYVWVQLPGSSRVLRLCEVLVLGALPSPVESSRAAITNPTHVTSCRTTVSPGGLCGLSSNLCCPRLTPCCGSQGACSNSTASCAAGCDAQFSFNAQCQVAS